MASTIYSQKARDYALYRPQYADEAIYKLIDVAGIASTGNVADIGSGTGNVSRHFVEKANQVFAVEPDIAMRYQAELLLGKYISFKSVDATAEKTTLQDNSIDLIVIGQAVHWFDLPAARKEFERILKPDGWLSLIWNCFEATPGLDIDFLFYSGTQNRYTYPVVFRETWTQFFGGMRSSSRNPNKDDDGYEEFEKHLKRIFKSQAVDNLITVKYTTELAIGRLNHGTFHLSGSQKTTPAYFCINSVIR